MTQKNNVSPRQKHHDQVDPGEVNNGVPLEIPMGQEPSARSIAQQIQDQIAIQLSKKGMGVEQQTPEQILAELQDLEPDDPDPPWTSQYQVQDLIEEELQMDEMDPEGAENLHEVAPPDPPENPVPPPEQDPAPPAV